MDGLRERFAFRYGIEGNDGIYSRVQKLKSMLETEIISDMNKQNYFGISNKNKILVITH